MKAVKNFFRTFFIVIAVLAIAFAALVIYAVVTDSKLPEDLTSFSEESLERSIDDAWQSGEAELRLHYETGDMTLGELEQHVSDYLTLLSEQNPRYWYTVRNAGYSLVEYTDYFEAVLSFLYQEQPVSYDELPRAATTRDALALLAPSLRDGETVFTFLAENGWTYPNLMDDEASALFQGYGITSLPTTFLILADGTVLGYVEGHMTADRMLEVINLALEASGLQEI